MRRSLLTAFALAAVMAIPASAQQQDLPTTQMVEPAPSFQEPYGGPLGRDAVRGDAVLRDDFRDLERGYSENWTVATGVFWIEPQAGLRTSVVPYEAEPLAAGQGPRGASTIIELSPGGGEPARSGTGPSLSPDRDRPEPSEDAALGGESFPSSAESDNEIYARARIPNAFAVSMDLRLIWIGPQSSLEFGPYQQDSRDWGYRLVYAPEEAAPLSLRKVTPRGQTTIASYTGNLNLADGRIHAIDWRRGRDGTMTVQVDGREVIRIVDYGFRDPFNGFTIINRGGSYAVHSVAIGSGAG